MSNGDFKGVTWEWVAGGMGTVALASVAFWARMIHGRSAGQVQQLARMEEFCRAQIQINKDVTQLQMQSNKDLQDGITGVHQRLDRLIEKATFRKEP